MLYSYLGQPFNPWARTYIQEIIQSGISPIDVMNFIAQSVAIMQIHFCNLCSVLQLLVHKYIQQGFK